MIKTRSNVTLLTVTLVATGNGYYIYIESSYGRPRDKARLQSPRMNGTQCMTFHYNFYGETMSCVVVYIQSADGTERVVWVKSGHWGDRWIKTQIETNDDKADYRVGFCVLVKCHEHCS